VNTPITTTYSIYWLLLVFGLAGVISYTLYYKKVVKSGLTNNQSVFLSSLRFIMLSVIGFLLINPVLKISIKERQKPIIIFAQDNSESMVLSKDSLFIKDSLPNIRESLLRDLSDKYDVRMLEFGSNVKGKITSAFDNKESNFELLFKEFNTTYFNKNIGALVIVSDGIYNRGIDPIYSSKHLNFPIYTIPIGDTTQKMSLLVKDIEYNKIAYKGTKFPLIVDIKADFVSGNKIKIEVFNGKEALKDKIVSVDNDMFFKKIPFNIDAVKTGVFKYKIKVSLLDSISNKQLSDKKDIYVDIKKNKRKILLLQNGAHPDVDVFKQVVDANPTFDIEVNTPKMFKGDIKKYTLVILHQLPSKSNSIERILTNLIDYNIPILFVFGEKTSLKYINNLNLFLKIKQRIGLFDNVFAKVNSNFALFNVEIDDTLIVNMPPLHTPWGDFKTIFKDNILLYQKSGGVVTEKPLWMFTELGKQRIGFILGEGLWRWRLFEYKENRNHFLTDELITKTVNFLAIKERVSPFMLNYSKIIVAGHSVVFKAKIFNKSNEFIRSANIKIDITDYDNNKYSSDFKSNENEYISDLGNLSVGKYKFIVTAEYGANSIQKRGEFVIVDNNIEQDNLLADYNLMYKLAKKSGGDMVSKNNILTLTDKIKDNSNIKSVEYFTVKTKELTDIKVLLFVLLLLIITEWFLRKYWGVV